MSAPLNSITQQQQEIDFAAPSALEEEVVGTSALTGLDNLILAVPNVITDITNFEDPAGVHSVSTARDEGTRKFLGTTKQFLTTFNGSRRPGYPRLLNRGRFQYVSKQGTGAVEAHKLIITYVQPLVQ